MSSEMAQTFNYPCSNRSVNLFPMCDFRCEPCFISQAKVFISQ